MFITCVYCAEVPIICPTIVPLSGCPLSVHSAVHGHVTKSWEGREPAIIPHKIEVEDAVYLARSSLAFTASKRPEF